MAAKCDSGGDPYELEYPHTARIELGRHRAFLLLVSLSNGDIER